MQPGSPACGGVENGHSQKLPFLFGSFHPHRMCVCVCVCVRACVRACVWK